MKILQLVPELHVGGVERGTVDMARVLIMKGHEAHVISGGGELVAELEAMGAHHLTLPVHKKSLTALPLIKVLVRYIEEHGIEIVHARSRVPAWIGYFATRYTDADFITTCHGYYSKHLMSRVMGWGKRVIAISNVIARHMIDDFHVPEERIRLVPRGVDLDEFSYSPLDKRWPAKHDIFRIVNIGRITPLKGHKDFIRSLHWLKQKGKRFEAWIVGSAPAKREKHLEELKELTKHLRLSDQVKFLGHQKDIVGLLKQAHILVLSTTVPEAFGRVVAEAGAVGTAVVATRVGGVTDIVREELDGRLVPPHDPAKMAEAIQAAIEHKDETLRYSKSLYSHVKENFRLDQMYEKTLSVYREVLEERRILVIKLGALGDLVLISPSLRLLRKRFPMAHITLLVDEKFYEVAVNFPFVDEVIVTHRKKEGGGLRRFLKLAKKVREKRFDMSIDFQNTRKTHLLSYLSGIPRRLGYRRGIFRFLLTRGQEGFRDPLPPIPHQLRVLRGLGLGVGFCDERLELRTSEAAQARVSAMLTEALYDPDQRKEKLIGFSLRASAKWTSKNWPLESYVKLGRMLLKDHPARIVLFGAPEEKRAGEVFMKLFHPDKAINLIGKTSMGEMLELIRQLDLLVGPDSAPLHVASAFNVALIALFGPTDARRHAPPGDKKVILEKTVSCGPCYKRTCRENEHRCMTLITVDEAYSAAKKLMDRV